MMDVLLRLPRAPCSCPPKAPTTRSSIQTPDPPESGNGLLRFIVYFYSLLPTTHGFQLHSPLHYGNYNRTDLAAKSVCTDVQQLRRSSRVAHLHHPVVFRRLWKVISTPTVHSMADATASRFIRSSTVLYSAGDSIGTYAAIQLAV